jgi:hypothetical protein
MVDAPRTEAAEAVCAALRAQVARLGLSIGDEPVWLAATVELTRDPFTQASSLVATWRGGQRFGTATFFPDGRVFAEYQVLQALPKDPEQFVEAVQVWGTPDALRGDAVIVAFPA